MNPETSSDHPPTPIAAIPGLALAHGQTGRLLAALLPWLNQGGRCYCLDGGNCFDPYELAIQARRQGLDALAPLERVMISRAYTCHQLLEATTTMLGQLADHPTPPLALILGIDHLFWADEISLAERRRIFSRLLLRTGALLRQGLPLLITLARAQDAGRQAALQFVYAPFRLLNAESELPLILPASLRLPPLAIPPAEA